MQSALERRQELFELLCKCRHEIIDNLAFRFGVSRRTIERDIEILSLTKPIYTTKGTGGGVHIVDGYIGGMKYMTQDETEFLENIANTLKGDDLDKMKRIINRFGLPKGGKSAIKADVARLWQFVSTVNRESKQSSLFISGMHTTLRLNRSRKVKA